MSETPKTDAALAGIQLPAWDDRWDYKFRQMVITAQNLEELLTIAQAALSAAEQRAEGMRKVLIDLGAEDAEFGQYESEYDGRTYTFCKHCDYQDDVRPVHRDDCPTHAARALATGKSGEGEA